MAKKTRYPQRLNWQDYRTFMKTELLPWLVLQIGRPDYMASLVTGLDVKVDAYETALNLYLYKSGLAPDQRELLTIKFKALREELIKIKMALPVFFGDPAILGEFNLAGNISNDEDDMFAVATNCLAHWALVALLPEYADLAPDFAGLQTVFDDYSATRTMYTQTFQESQIAQNDMITAREVCNEHERKIFDWYNSRHRNPHDEWWTGSPWGAVGENAEPEPEGEGVPWPGPMAEFNLKIVALPLTVDIYCSRIFGCPRCVLERQQEGTGVWEYITEYPLDADEILPFRDTVPYPGRWHYRASPFNAAGEPGMSSEGSVDVM